MELVYLWVEGYKNIHKQGFNFSPRFECTFHDKYKEDGTLEDDCELDICDKKEELAKKCEDNNDYIENFFGDNINVTAIVGKNGSGKSSVFKIILFLLAYQWNPKLKLESLASAFFILSDEEGEKYISYNSNNKFDIKQFKGDLDFYTIYFNYMLDTLADENEDNFINNIYHKNDAYATPLLIEPYKKDGKIDLNNLEYLTKSRFANIFSKYDKDDFIGLFFKPNRLKYSINTEKTRVKIVNIEGIEVPGHISINKSDNQDNQPAKILHEIIEENPQVKDDCEALCLELKKQLGATPSSDEIDLIKINNNYIKSKIFSSQELYKENITSRLSKENVIQKNLDEEKDKKNAKEKTDLFLRSILRDCKNTPHYEYQKIEKSASFYYEILGNKKNKNIFDKYLNQIIDITKVSDIINFLPPWVDIEYYEDEKSYSSLSSGQKAIFSFLMGLIYHIKNISDKNMKQKYETLNFFLDETELGLHPEWQKIYLKQIISALKGFRIDINLVFATHSPFLLSDLPKENVIFLDTDEKGNCKVVDGLKDKQQTFGANIHTLLSDGFFMEDGLMGEFAKRRITTILRFLNGQNTFINISVNQSKILLLQNNFIKKGIKPIIKLIGEDFLREKLLSLFDKKYPISKDEKIKQLEKELKELKND